MIESLLGRVSGGDDLTSDEMRDAMNQIMEGQWEPPQIGLFLMGLRSKGETVDEIVGAALSLRQHMVKIHSPHKVFVDTCGTGGDGSGTFNISTAAALVTAATGLPVAKHGNRSVTSKSGSSEVLAELGVNIDANVEQVERCLAEVGICFCYAPLMHRSMRHVAEVRKQLGVRTIFNLLGPLCNPASAPFQLMGIGIEGLVPHMSRAIQKLGIKRALVVRGRDGLDEVTIGDVTDICEVTSDTIETSEWTPEQFGVERARKSQLTVAGVAESAAWIGRILEGEPGPARDIVVVNAAAALATANAEPNLGDCVAKVQEAIDSGSARRLLAKLAEVSHL